MQNISYKLYMQQKSSIKTDRIKIKRDICKWGNHGYTELTRVRLLRPFSPVSLSPHIALLPLIFLAEFNLLVLGRSGDLFSFYPDTSFLTQTFLCFPSLSFFVTSSVESLFFLHWRSFKVSKFLLGKTTLFIHSYLSCGWHIYIQ